MKVLFLDDSKQRRCNRANMGSLVAIGGIEISAEHVRPLEQELERICRIQFEFPGGEPFKWSPARDHWMRNELVGDRRIEFFRTILRAVAVFGGVGQVVLTDPTRALANQNAPNSEVDALMMSLERFDTALPNNEIGMVVVARPSGGRVDEDDFLSNCADFLDNGTNYTAFERIAMNILTMPSKNSRILQAADLVVSISTAMVAGHTEFAHEASKKFCK
ncbi:DUF3800 domain-containing protein [uncultured Roseibium sp.]|uniref:DUF3800 domain-containing protein n=1 Tax=uncultured Roseibium sp. TaxID=1936171 RepID=UPI0025925A9B|nr:DUF3800 domain-containing protein [uncultured Roseibium sp.]